MPIDKLLRWSSKLAILGCEVEKPYCCDDCEESFASIEEMNSHDIIHNREKRNDIFSCLSCEKSFEKFNDWRRHKRCHDEKQFSCKENLNEQRQALHDGKRNLEY